MESNLWNDVIQLLDLRETIRSEWEPHIESDACYTPDPSLSPSRIACLLTGSARGRIESEKRQVTMLEQCMHTRTEVRMHLRFSRGQAFLMIITQKLVQEINRLVRYEPLVLGGNKPRPGFLRVAVARRMRDSHRHGRNTTQGTLTFRGSRRIEGPERYRTFRCSDIDRPCRGLWRF